MLYPENTAYVEDLLSYHAVGARSVEDQLHRQVASGVEAPVGLKNPMSGNIIALVNSIFAAQSPQVFKYGNYQVSSGGNPSSVRSCKPNNSALRASGVSISLSASLSCPCFRASM